MANKIPGRSLTTAAGPAYSAAVETPVLGCYRHEKKEAVDTCRGCGKPICEVCSMAVGAGFFCPPCANRKAGQRRTARLLLAAAICLALAAAAWAVATYYPFEVDYGERTATIHRLSKRLDQDPCDRVKMLKLAEELFAAEDFPRLIERSRKFFAGCDPFPRLRWLTYAAHKELGQYLQAIAEVSALIDQYPFDYDFRWWRAEVYERLRKYPEAISDYRQSLALAPELDSIPFKLADVLERAGRPCEGILPLANFLYHHSGYGQNPNVLGKLDRLFALPACVAYSGTGEAVLDLPAGDEDPPPTVRVKLNGQAEGAFRLDPTSAYLVLSPDFAARLHLAAEPSLLLRHEDQVVKAGLAFLDQVEVGTLRAPGNTRDSTLRAHKVEALVLEKLEGGADGILGMSFLARFTFQQDPDTRKLELAPWATTTP